MSDSPIPSHFDNNNKFVDQIRNNTKSDLIEITEDKLENILLKHLVKLRKTQEWLTPLTLSITLLIVLLTAEFKNFLSIGKEVWQALFILGLILSVIWLFKSLFDAIKCSKKTSIEFLINQIKNSQR